MRGLVPTRLSRTPITKGITTFTRDVNDPLIKNKTVTLDLLDQLDGLDRVIALEMVGVGDMNQPPFFDKILYFRQDVGFHGPIIENNTTPNIERKPPHLTFDFTPCSFIAIIFGTPRDKFHNVITERTVTKFV